MSAPFDHARRRLLAKMLSELTWEEVLHPEGTDHYRLPLASGPTYRFRAMRGIWDNLDIDPGSLSLDNSAHPCPLQFAVNAQTELGMTPATHATFLRELSNTLRQDIELLRLYGSATADEMIHWPTTKLHAALNGHPKAVANKGRLGWGSADLDAYAPEYARPIQLSWLAIHRNLLRSGRSDSMDNTALLDRAIGAKPAETLRQKAGAAGARPEDHVLMPVHPWQMQAHLAQAFTVELSQNQIIDLGLHGPDFVATPSIRTLTPATGGPFDVKLSLGILNTSAWRGMPGKYIEHGGAISDWLTGLVNDDPVLKPCVTVLREVAGDWVRHPLIAACPDAPYRHHELLGALWRENADHRAGPGQRAVMASALFHEGACGTPLAVAYANKAGMPIDTWLAALFEVTVVPLWHMLCRYGVGFIAHGQNITVILENNMPVGMAVKDFQGDLDLVDQDFPEMADLDPAIRALLPRKPPAYIVHDIQTAHFITVLRFLSAALSRSGALAEDRFYALLAKTLRTYATAHPELADRQQMFDLFAPLMPKVCINRVRFAIGYEDSAERPLPARGTDLTNPLWTMPDGPIVSTSNRYARTAQTTDIS
ncbi:aerobactin synthase [Yoonia maricola]|uniref:Aerobactin synthase n=1 Tax=Yoonia maricola TaxID=420999 RepID=A0A2M8W046_9RHOB|nr:IucA/IucC family protein [Yoonia maricola]PJI84284.1 aerobactin synthase [Yoonia maricola]